MSLGLHCIQKVDLQSYVKSEISTILCEAQVYLVLSMTNSWSLMHTKYISMKGEKVKFTGSLLSVHKFYGCVFPSFHCAGRKLFSENIKKIKLSFLSIKIFFVTTEAMFSLQTVEFLTLCARGKNEIGVCSNQSYIWRKCKTYVVCCCLRRRINPEAIYGMN